MFQGLNVGTITLVQFDNKSPKKMLVVKDAKCPLDDFSHPTFF